jgi:hypothetical protein
MSADSTLSSHTKQWCLDRKQAEQAITHGEKPWHLQDCQEE